jgi:hypothetical protein
MTLLPLARQLLAVQDMLLRALEAEDGPMSEEVLHLLDDAVDTLSSVICQALAERDRVKEELGR